MLQLKRAMHVNFRMHAHKLTICTRPVPCKPPPSGRGLGPRKLTPHLLWFGQSQIEWILGGICKHFDAAPGRPTPLCGCLATMSIIAFPTQASGEAAHLCRSGQWRHELHHRIYEQAVQEFLSSKINASVQRILRETHWSSLGVPVFQNHCFSQVGGKEVE